MIVLDSGDTHARQWHTHSTLREDWAPGLCRRDAARADRRGRGRYRHTGNSVVAWSGDVSLAAVP
jgi:hypothetical protein